MVTTPESGVAPGATVVVPAAAFVMVSVSEAVGRPPSTVKATAGPPVPVTLIVSSPKPGRHHQRLGVGRRHV